MKSKLIVFAAVLMTYQIHQVAGQPQFPEDEQARADTIQGSAAIDSNSPVDVADVNNDENRDAPFNLPLKTSGGAQFWTDHRWQNGFHIQQNALTGHWRILDRENVRRGWGNKSQCLATMEKLCDEKTVPTKESPEHYVILLHGLMRTSGSMSPLAEKFKTQGFEVISFSYASTRASIADHASALREVVEHLPKDAKLSFCGHSMGNIVVRHFLGDVKRDGDPQAILPRCQSMVMLGPPNQGASIARNLAKTGLFELVTGKGGMELGPNWGELNERLATPHFPFAIVAGDVSGSPVQNPLVGASGDFVVGLEEAKLDGAEQFETVPVLHSFLMNDEKCVQMTVDFVNNHHPTN